MNPGGVNQNRFGRVTVAISQCTVGNVHPAKGITGDYWLFLITLLRLTRLRRWPLVRLWGWLWSLLGRLALNVVLPPVQQTLGQGGEMLIANPCRFEGHGSLSHIIKARPIGAMRSTDNFN